MRILLLTPDFPPDMGGVQLMALRLAGGWAGERVLVVTSATPGSAVVDAGLRADVRRVAAPRVGGHRAAMARLNLEAIVAGRKFAPDVVVNMHVVASPAALAIRRLTGVPYVQFLYANEVVERPGLTRAAIRGAAAVVVLSEFTRALAVRHGAAASRVHTIPPGVDVPPPPPEAVGRSAAPLMVTVARMAEPYKGHDVTLRALVSIRERVPGVCWVVIGDGPLAGELQAQARRLGVEDAVNFVGPLDDRERDQCLRRAWLFVMPSRISAKGGGEGFGICYLEAGAHRLPVIAGAVGGALAAVEDGVTGLLVDPTDPAAVADAAVRVLTDSALRESLGAAGERRARAASWDVAAERVLGLLRDAAAG